MLIQNTFAAMIILDMKKYGAFFVLIGTDWHGTIVWREVREINAWASESYAFSTSNFMTKLMDNTLGWPGSINAYGEKKISKRHNSLCSANANTNKLICTSWLALYTGTITWT